MIFAPVLSLSRDGDRGPQALRVLVQGADDASPIDFALSIAQSWTDRPILVINASGKDIRAFAAGRSLVELRDDKGRPTRSLTEIVEALKPVSPDAFGACVVLDTNRLYRATRCSVRDLRSIENLSAGDWDNTNEALGMFCETLTRLGLPTVFYAPPTDIYRTNEFGESVVTGSKSQGWKDLPRSSHVHLVLSRRARDLIIEVAGDDWGRIGKPGTEIVGTTGAWVGEALSSLARAARPGEASGTTLAESSANELAARTRAAEARRAASAELRTRLLNIAELRAFQGPDAWDDYTREISESVELLTADDLNQVTKRTSEALARHERNLAWQRGAENSLELSRHSLHEQFGGALWGPSIHESPARDDMPVERLFGLAPEHAALEIRSATRDDLCCWIGSLARYAGVWSEASFAVVCLESKLPGAGAGWYAYFDEGLRELALRCLSLARTRFQWDPPKPEPARLRAVDPGDGSTGLFDLYAAAEQAAGPQQTSAHLLEVELPDVGEFAQFVRGPAGDLLNLILTQWGWRDRIAELFEQANVAPPSKPQDAHRWPPETRVRVYRFLLSDRTERIAS